MVLLLCLPPLFSLGLIPSLFSLISLVKSLPLTLGNLWPPLLAVNLLLLLATFKKPYPKIKTPPKKQIFLLSLVLISSLLLLLAPYFRPHLGPFWSTYNFGKGRDIEDRIGLIIGLKKYGLPPKNPFIPNQSLNYYYFYHLDAAILSSLGDRFIPPELSHLILSGTIMISAILLTSFFVRPLVLIVLFLGYGFDFFMMIPALLKIYPYQGEFNHVDQWVAPFVWDLKVNPFSVWFTWVPHHSLSLFLSLVFIGIFLELIEIRKAFKQIVLAFLLLAILGTSSYIFLGDLVILLCYWFFQGFTQKRVLIKDYLFLLIALPFTLALILPMILRINTPTISLYPFWQFPRDHLFSFKFPESPLSTKIILLTFFLAERFLIFLWDLGLIFILAIFSWNKSPRTPFYRFTKIILIASVLVSVMLRSIPSNNDLCYRVSGFSWLACAFLANLEIEKFWRKIKKSPILAIALMVILFSPTIIEQIIFPNLKFGQDFWQMKKFVDQKISPEAIVQSPPNSEPSALYLLERKVVYSSPGLLYYPDPKATKEIEKDLLALFQSDDKKEVDTIVKSYKIDFLILRSTESFNNPSRFKEIFKNQGYSIYQTNNN